MATKTQTRSDNNLREDVLLELKWDPKISLASDIAVAVKDGVVTLSGFVQVTPKASSAEVKSKIEEALRRSAELDARRITVKIEGSTVKLYGSVSSWAERDEAERAAWSAPGTTMVENHILVNP